MSIGGILSIVAPNSFPAQKLWPPASKFEPERDIPDQSGKVVLITGGNAGIGFGTATHLLKKGAKVYIACRSASKAKEAINELQQLTGKTAYFVQLDLSDLTSVRRCAEEFSTKESTLDLLICNAGIMNVPTDQLTAQGYDAQWGTNVLGHYLLIKHLLPILAAACKTSGDKARVINYSSGLDTTAPGKTGFEVDSLVGGPRREAWLKKGTTENLYGQSKMGATITTHIFNEISPDVAFATVHPGVLRSGLSVHLPKVQRAVFNAIFYPIKFGPYTALFAATVAPIEKFTDAYFIPWARYGKGDPRGDDKATVQKVKQWLDKAIEGL